MPCTGALVAYLWKNQHIQQSREQLVSIASIVIFNVILGSWEETSIDNLGDPSAMLGLSASLS
jgi:hypothetical protein